MISRAATGSTPAPRAGTGRVLHLHPLSLTWQCTYDNTGSNGVVSGPSAQTNEMCMATGYYFPATGPKFEYVTGGNCYGL